MTKEPFVHPSSYLDDDVELGPGTKVWHFCHLSRGARVGADCVLGQNCYLGGDVVLGDRCKLQNNVSVYTRVTLEEGVFCGPSCVFTNDRTPRALFPKGRTAWEPTLCRRGATIGANATIVCGVTLGAHCMVAAGAVVTHDVPDFALVQGVPARRVGWVCACGERLEVSAVTATDAVVCGACQRSYRLAEDRLSPINEPHD